MSAAFGRLRQPRNIGIVCALAATGLGLFYLATAGAPARYLMVNLAALLLGVAAFFAIARAAPPAGRVASAAIALLAACLVATALLGAPVDGASRWIRIGPLSVQTSLVVLPPMIVLFARRPDRIGMLGMAAAAAALALQPDRAMSGVLALGLALLAIARPNRLTAVALIVAIAGFVIALTRPDRLPAVPFVDRILFTAFELGLPAGAAVLIGALILPIPALAGALVGKDGRPAFLVFGAVWSACILAAALGNYPTPVVGYGGSAILGYLLSLSVLPSGHRRAAAGGGKRTTSPSPARGRGPG